MDLIVERQRVEHKRAWIRQSRHDWTQFSRRVGVGPGQFADRLARARLLFLRRRDVMSNWLALALVLSLLPPLFVSAPVRAQPRGEIQTAIAGQART